MALKTFFDDEVLYAADVNKYLVNSLLARKTADESLEVDTTLQDDDHLTFAVDASTTYHVLGLFLVNDEVTGATRLKMQFSAPSGATVYGGLGSVGTKIADGDDRGLVDMTAISVSTDLFSTLAGGLNPGGLWHPLFVRALLVVGINSGTFKLQWAQETSSGSDVRLKTNSFLWLRRVQ